MSRPGVRSILVNAFYSLAAVGSRTFVRGLYAVILARLLSPELYGLFNYGLSYSLALLPLSAMGLDTVLATGVGGRHEDPRALVSRTLTLRVALAALVSAAGVTGAFVLEASADARHVLLVMSLAVFFRSVSLLASSVFTAYERSRDFLPLEAGCRTLEVVAGTTWLVFGAGIVELAVVHAGVWLVQAIVSLVLIHRRLVRLALDLALSPLVSLLRRAAPLGVATISETWLLASPVVLFKHQRDDGEALGQLALVMQMLVLSQMIPVTLARASLPVVTRASARADGTAPAFLATVCRAVLALGAVAAFVASAFAAPLATAVFGDAYAQAAALVAPAVWILIPSALATLGTHALYAQNRRTLPAIGVSAGALTMTCGIVLVPEASVVTAIASFGAGAVVWAIIVLFGASSWLRTRTVGSFFVSFAVVLGLFAAFVLLPERWPRDLIALGMAVVVVVVEVLRLVWSTSQREQLRAVWTALRG